MKKIVSLILATVLLASVSVFAAVPDVTAGWANTVHVSNDEIKPGIVCGGVADKINYYSAPTGTAEVGFWGWASADNSDFAGFSYSINGGEKVTDASFKVAAEQAVIEAGPGAYDSRFDVAVAVAEGTQLVRIFADYADGTSEAVWACEVTIGEATDYEDAAGGADAPATNPETADTAVIAIVVVATIALAGVTVSKKVRA